MSCNRSGHDVHDPINPFYSKWEIYLSEGDVKDMNAMMDMGAGVSALADALKKWAVLEAETPPGVGTAIASVLLVEKGLINYHADGCGVKITVHLAGGIAYQNIESQ